MSHKGSTAQYARLRHDAHALQRTDVDDALTATVLGDGKTADGLAAHRLQQHFSGAFALFLPGLDHCSQSALLDLIAICAKDGLVENTLNERKDILVRLRLAVPIENAFKAVHEKQIAVRVLRHPPTLVYSS